VEPGLVSVIIPAYQAEQFVAEAIDSVLAQTYRPIEIIVVDDGSSDGTRAAVERYGSSVRYEYQPHAGISVAKNRGIELAVGDFLAFLDADDLWAEDKLAWQTAALQADSELDMIFGYVQQFPSPELAGEIEKKIRYIAEPVPAYLGGTMLIRRDTFLRTASFDTQWQVGEFVDWYLKAIDSGLHSAIQPRVVLRRRLHDANHGIKKSDARADYVRIVKAALDRRKAKALAADPGKG
jgi:glycosyltransferase involved in cell wall biosynthesis